MLSNFSILSDEDKLGVLLSLHGLQETCDQKIYHKCLQEKISMVADLTIIILSSEVLYFIYSMPHSQGFILHCCHVLLHMALLS